MFTATPTPTARARAIAQLEGGEIFTEEEEILMTPPRPLPDSPTKNRKRKRDGDADGTLEPVWQRAARHVEFTVNPRRHVHVPAPTPPRAQDLPLRGLRGILDRRGLGHLLPALVGAGVANVRMLAHLQMADLEAAGTHLPPVSRRLVQDTIDELAGIFRVRAPGPVHAPEPAPTTV